MADIVTQTKPITRNKLAQWLPNHEAVKALESLTADVPALGEAANDLQSQLNVAAGQITLLQGNVDNLTTRVTLLETEVAELQNEVAVASALLAQFNALRAQLGKFTKFVNDFNSRPKP